MKNILLPSILFVLAIACTSAPAREKFVINGTVTGGPSTGYVYLNKLGSDSYSTVDSSLIENGKFNFEGTADQPGVYSLSRSGGRLISFFIENSTMDISLGADRASTVIKGSANNDLFYAVLDSLTANMDFNLKPLIAKNPSSPVLAFVLNEWAPRMSLSELKEAVNMFDSSLAPALQTLQERIKIKERLEIGSVAPDFSQNDPDGNPVSLSSFRGKYILVDFWASWCPPCRAENPNLVNAYHKFKDKGFTVFGVSLDRDKAAWLKGIEDDKLEWAHVSDLAYWQSSAAAIYEVRSIPANFLLDPDGKILAKNLRGEELHIKLKEILGE